MGETRIWERQPGEPERAFAQFLLYLESGDGRTIAEAYRKWWHIRNKHKIEQGLVRDERQIQPPQVWYTTFRDWNWEKRARAYDIHVRQSRIDAEREDEDRLRKEARDNRRNLLNASLGTLAKSLEVMNKMLEKHEQEPVPLELGQLMQANMALVKELRTEFGDDPKAKVELSGPDGGPLVVANIDQIREERWKLATEALLAAEAPPSRPSPVSEKDNKNKDKGETAGESGAVAEGGDRDE